MRRMRFGRLVFLAAAVVGLPAAGQVGPTQTGRELDANYQIGSGGQNLPSPQDPGLRSRLLVTGQVGGLAAFRGPLPYLPPDQLQVNVPSGGLLDFNRRSVGLPDIARGPSFAPGPYYERAVTAFDAGRIVAGQTMPGSNVPLTSAGPPALARQLLQDATRDYRSVQRYTPWQTPGTDSQRPAFAPAILPAQPSPAGQGGQVPAMISWPGAEAMFGIVGFQDRQRLAAELYEAAAPDVRLDSRQDARIDFRREDGVSRTGQRPTVGKAPGETEGPPGLSRIPEGPWNVNRPVREERPSGLPQPGQDAYVDLLRTMRRRLAAEQQAPTPASGPFTTLTASEDFPRSFTQPAVPRPASPSAMSEDLAEAFRVDRETDAQTSVEVRHLVELLPDKGILLHSLAGKGADLFNLHMKRGELLLRTGHYYDAADQFALAAIADPANPLAAVGQCLGYFLAGEALTAGMHLRHAMELFPPIMEARLDLPLMTRTEAFRRQIIRLDERLSREDSVDPRLAMLGAYLYHSTGQKDDAKAAARKLQAAAGDDELYKAQAEFVLVGRRPAQATSRPDG